MKAALAGRRSKPLSIRPRVKLWLELDDGKAFCPGTYRILQEIVRTGSIKDAALKVGRSYRFVWDKLKDVERALGAPLVESRVGGKQDQRSALTPLGELLAQEFDLLRKKVFEMVDHEVAPRLQIAVERLRGNSRR